MLGTAGGGSRVSSQNYGHLRPSLVLALTHRTGKTTQRLSVCKFPIVKGKASFGETRGDF